MARTATSCGSRRSPTSGRPTARNRDALIGAAMARYVETLEALCREAPYNWFNFFDFWAADAAPPTAAVE